MSGTGAVYQRRDKDCAHQGEPAAVICQPLEWPQLCHKNLIWTCINEGVPPTHTHTEQIHMLAHTYSQFIRGSLDAEENFSEKKSEEKRRAAEGVTSSMRGEG